MTLAMKVVAHKRLWVTPALKVLKVLVYARVIKEKHLKPLAGFIARFGFKFNVEK